MCYSCNVTWGCHFKSMVAISTSQSLTRWVRDTRSHVCTSFTLLLPLFGHLLSLGSFFAEELCESYFAVDLITPMLPIALRIIPSLLGLTSRVSQGLIHHISHVSPLGHSPIAHRPPGLNPRKHIRLLPPWGLSGL